MKIMRKNKNKKIIVSIVICLIISLFFTYSIVAIKPKDTHYIFGTARFTDGNIATGAHIFIVSEQGTIETYVNGSGAWKINCGDPGPNWPEYTNFTLYIDGCCSHDSWCGKATGIIEGSETDMGDILAHPNQEPVTPEIVLENEFVQMNMPLSITIFGYDPDEIHSVSYRLDYDANGSHDYSSFGVEIPFGEQYETTHSYTSPGTYAISAIARDDHGLKSPWSDPIEIYVYESNQPPTSPVITGPDEGMIHESNEFEIISTDDTNELEFFIDWDDGTIQNWTDIYQSNEPAYFSHTWHLAGSYEIRVIARDRYGFETEKTHNIYINGPSITLSPLKNSIFSVKTTVTNDGNIETEHGTYTINVEGNGVIRGSLSEGNIPSLEPGETWQISSDFLFGFNPNVLISITATIPDCEPEVYSTNALLLFGFVKII